MYKAPQTYGIEVDDFPMARMARDSSTVANNKLVVNINSWMASLQVMCVICLLLGSSMREGL